jgi:hypothetical protein
MPKIKIESVIRNIESTLELWIEISIDERGVIHMARITSGTDRKSLAELGERVVDLARTFKACV